MESNYIPLDEFQTSRIKGNPGDVYIDEFLDIELSPFFNKILGSIG